LPNAAMRSMNLRCALKLKKAIEVKLSRLPPVGFAKDLETGAFEIDASEIVACARLEAHHPDAQIWIVRVGSRYVRRFGGRTDRIL
jgi:hypothetical protein